MLLMGTLIVAVALLIRVGQAKRTVEESWNELYDYATNPTPGMFVPVYEGVTTAGDTVALGETTPGRRQILYFFTTSCPYCRASVPSWKALAELADSRADAEVFGVAIDSAHLTPPYQDEHDLTYPVVGMHDQRYAGLFRAGSVPVTMVVNPNGQIAYARLGEFSTEAALDSVRVVLDQPLPETEVILNPGELSSPPSEVGEVSG